MLNGGHLNGDSSLNVVPKLQHLDLDLVHFVFSPDLAKEDPLRLVDVEDLQSRTESQEWGQGLDRILP